MTTTAQDSPPAAAQGRLVFIGAGGIAKTHAAAAKTLGEAVAVAAVADPSADARADFSERTGAPAYESAEALFSAVAAGDLAADAAVVCTPPSVRAPLIAAALEAGLSVLVEKPLAIAPAEADALLQLEAEHPARICAVGYCHRFTPAVLEMQRRAQAGDIGRVTRFENTFAFHHQPMSERWFSDPAVSGGGSLIDTGCHSLDLFAFLAGPPEPVGLVADRPWPGRGDSSATLLVKSADTGAAGVICSGWLEPARFHVRLVGTEGSFFYDYEKPTELLRAPADGPVETIAVETHDVRFARQLQAFLHAAQTGTPAREAGLATFDDGRIVAQAVDSAHRLGSLI